ncbi:MAG TPA: CHAT domain-containing protein [Pseudomonadota bacterium]|nr:CHAT domain-containing protein [Pseudomonadota bacterium]
MLSIRSIAIELQRPGPPHNQMLSPLTPYLAMCPSQPANTVYLDFEQKDFLLQAQGLDYGLSPQYQLAQLEQTGVLMGRFLANIRSLPTVIAEASDPVARGAGLIHLQLISDAAELAMLPFEAAVGGIGFPGEGQPLLLQSDAPICLTRGSRKTGSREMNYFRPDQKILFAYAEFPGSPVPAKEHLLALRRAFNPWCPAIHHEARLEWANKRITVLRNATLEEIRNACSQEQYCYVHVLAHGMPRQKLIGREQEFGLALHDSMDRSKLDFIDGTRLAAALCGRDRLGQNFFCPKVVTLAACDSGHQGTLVVRGGSIAHALHLAGIPLVVASQFPLTIPGSTLLTDILYSGLLWGQNPFVLLHEVRRRLHMERSNSLDWASLVAYSNWPESLESNNLTFQYNQAVLALQAADHRLRARLGEGRDEKDGIAAIGGPQSKKHLELLQTELTQIQDFRTRMELVAPVLSQRVGSYIRSIDAEAAQMAEHNIDRASSRLVVQALIRESDLEANLGESTWQQTLVTAYRLISALHDRSHTRGLKLQYKELLLFLKLSVVLSRRLPQDEFREAKDALVAAIQRVQQTSAPILSSPPELWLRAGLVELLVLHAMDKQNTSSDLPEFDRELNAMCDLVPKSDPDDVDQVLYSYKRMEGWWKDKLPECVASAAKKVVDALRGKIQRGQDRPSVGGHSTVENQLPIRVESAGGFYPLATPFAEKVRELHTDLLYSFGEEERRLVRTPADVFPLECLCRVQATIGGQLASPGTGFLLGPRLIVTAAHNVLRPNQTTSEVKVFFARNGNVMAGEPLVLRAQDVLRVPENPQPQSPHDYAAILLPKDRIHRGYFQFAFVTDQELRESHLWLSGYPDFPPRGYPLTDDNRGLPTHPAPDKPGSVRELNENFIGYRLTTADGMSGSPLWVHTAQHLYTAVGIHVAGTSECNTAVRINREVANFFRRLLG